MSLEEHIKELTVAVVALTGVVQASLALAGDAPSKPATAAAPAVKRTAAPPVEETVVEDAASAAPAIKYEDLMKALTELGKALTAAGKAPKEIRELGIACLARVGAEKLPDIKEKPETWPRLLDVIKVVMEGGEP